MLIICKKNIYKMKVSFIILPVVILFTSSAFAQDNLQLVYINMVWRHGARSPIHEYPSDPLKNTTAWMQGPGQLTQLGRRQQYELGRFFRRRYNNLLSSTYYRSEIYVRSTDYDRTLMSAECNMAGLYPPHGRQMWNGSSTTWQPVPIHTIPQANDTLLTFPPKSCPKYNEIMSEVYKSPKYVAENNKYKEFLKELTTLTSWNGTLQLTNVWEVEDPIVCEKAQNLTLPAWVTPSRYEMLIQIAGVEMAFVYGLMNPEFKTTVAKMIAGELVEKILDNIESHISGTSTLKAIAYSAHDTTIGSLLAALDAFNMLPPPFAASIMFELHQDQENHEYFVKAFHRNESNDTPVQLQLLGCDMTCPLSELKKLAMPILARGKRSTYCGLTDPASPHDSNTDNPQYMMQFLYVVTGLLLLTWLALIIVACRKVVKKKSDKHDLVYQPLTAYDNEA